MKFVTRLLSGLLCLLLIFGTVACNGGGKKDPDASGKNDDTTGKTSSTDKNKQVELLVDLHGFIPSINKEPTAENPNVFLSTQKIADEFTKLNPNIKIKWARSKPVGGLQKELSEWFTTQINAGTCPAIAFTWGTAFQDRDWYYPLDDIISQPNAYVEGNTKWSDMFPSYLWTNEGVQDVKKRVVAIPVVLDAGPPTGYYYNKEAFAKANITSIPKTWEEFITASKKLKEAGYIPVAPWGFFKSAQLDQWVSQFCVSPSVGGYVKEKADYDKDGVVDSNELLRACKEGLYNPIEHDYARAMYKELKRYYTEVLAPGWENSDYMTPWNEGKVGMKEEGLWALQAENNNKGRKFDYGVFPAPIMSKDTTPFSAEIEYTEKGPYQPGCALQLNIMKPAVEKDPAILEAAVKFLQYLTIPDNISMIVLEQGAQIGAVKGTEIPPLLNEFLSNPFAKPTKAGWPSAFNNEQNLDMNKQFEIWVKGQMTDDEFFKKVNELQQKGADLYIEKMAIDTSGWKK